MSNSLLLHGDSLDVLRTLDPDTFDACVTDPPYGLGKEPDPEVLLRSWLDTGSHDLSRPREGRKHCFAYLLGVTSVDYTDRPDPKTGQMGISFSIEGFSSSVDGTVQLNSEMSLGKKEIHAKRTLGPVDDVLVDVGYTHLGEVAREHSLGLRKIEGFSGCVGSCTCFAQTTEGTFTVNVWLRYTPESESKPPTKIVATPRAEVRAVLTFDLARRTAYLSPADGANDFDARVELVAPKNVGALPGACGLTSPLQASRASHVVGEANGAGPWRIFLQGHVVDRLLRPRLEAFGFMQRTWDAFVPPPALWREVFRVMKPGAHLLCFAGTRTVDYMGIALRLAGFEIRDEIMWVYGQGFPKSLDVSKAIDKAAGAQRIVVGRTMYAGRSTPIESAGHREMAPGGSSLEVEDPRVITVPSTEAAKQWAGWGTALKPAHEPIIVARKPLAGTVADNVLRYGTGGINVDGCRVQMSEKDRQVITDMGGFGRASYSRQPGVALELSVNPMPCRDAAPHDAGRFPANVIHDGSPEVVAMFPDSAGQLAPSRTDGTAHDAEVYGKKKNVRRGDPEPRVEAERSAARFFQACPFTDEERVEQFLYYCAKAARRERNEGCEVLPQSETTRTALRDMKQPGCLDCGRSIPASVGVDFPCPRCGSSNVDWVAPKMDGSGRDACKVKGNTHPTVKPLALMRYLVRLVTPPGGLVLDPFAGSGTTALAADAEGAACVAVEREAEYCAIAEARGVPWPR